MKIKIVAFIILITLSLSSILKADGYYSYSFGQFDSNGYSDRYFQSFETRFEYLSNENFIEKYEIKHFLGLMLNSDSGKYFYAGLRKDFSRSHVWNLTPSFAVGYYDQGSSKDLGSELQFRSQIELSFNLEKQKRIAFSFNHISNANLASHNPGTESFALSFINPF